MKKTGMLLLAVFFSLFLFFSCAPESPDSGSSQSGSEVSASIPSAEHSSMSKESSEMESSEEESANGSSGISSSGESISGESTGPASSDASTSSKPNTTSVSSKPPVSTSSSKPVSTSSKIASTSSKKPVSSSNSSSDSGNAGFTWDKGGSYTGPIHIRENEVSGVQAAKEDAVIDYGNAANGYVMVKKGTSVKTKIRVAGPNGKTYQRYILPAADVFYGIPLQMGNGSYTVSIFQNTKGSLYKKLVEVTFTANIGTEYHLSPNIYANYNSNSASVRKGYGLCMNAKSDLDKVKSVYNFIVTTIKYDHAKAAGASASYVPVPDITLSSKKGICFDYASLMATMLRPQGIPVKIVFGYAGGVFHAWNDVYIKGKGWISVGIPSNGGWKRLDSTFGVSMPASYLENGGNYSATEYY